MSVSFTFGPANNTSNGTVRPMNRHIATLLSTGGILLSGVVAYSFNTAVLEGSGEQASRGEIPKLTSTTTVPAAGVTADAVDVTSYTVPGLPVSSPPVSETTPVPSATEPVAEVQSFQLDGVGVVTAMSTGRGVRVMGVSSRWESEVLTEGAASVVRFKDGGRVLELRITKGSTRLEARLTDVTPPPTTVGGKRPSREEHDGEHDDEHQEDEHEEFEDDD